LPPPIDLPNVVVQSASISDANVAPGAKVLVTADVTNRGTVNGSAMIKVYVNGEEEIRDSVSVESGKVKTVQFYVSRNQPGIYQVYVNGEFAGSFRVNEVIDPNLVLMLSTFLLVMALGLIIIYISRRQRGTY
jgi:hypothetical protein